MPNLLNKTHLIKIAKGWVLPILILLFWEYMSRQDPSRAYAFASVENMVSSVKETWLTGELQQSLIASVSRAFIGLAIGGGIGFTLGTLMSMSRR